MNFDTFYDQQIQDSIRVKQESLQACRSAIKESVDLIVGSFRNRGKLLICGNGGSAADAQHLAAELVVRLSHDIQRPGLPAIALPTDSSIMTAGGNDIGFDNVFARQVEALGQPEDVLLAISTSGNSPNVVKALHTAKAAKIRSIGFLGGNGGECKSLVTVPVIIPSSNTQRIQENHIMLGHIMLELVEHELFGKK